jgi:hypothetical protein
MKHSVAGWADWYWQGDGFFKGDFSPGCWRTMKRVQMV